MKFTMEDIARVCYEADRAFQIGQGNNAGIPIWKMLDPGVRSKLKLVVRMYLLYGDKAKHYGAFGQEQTPIESTSVEHRVETILVKQTRNALFCSIVKTLQPLLCEQFDPMPLESQQLALSF